MTTIVMNTLTSAVTEYDWDFQSLTPTHAGNDDGLAELGGERDAGEPIAATYMLGDTTHGTRAKKRPLYVYFGIRGGTTGLLRVASLTEEWAYDFQILAKGVSRAQPGRGIRETHLGIGFRNVGGADFEIDQMDPEFTSDKARSL
jgi:hypothetical protein